jgi:hypothetical protein
MPGSDPVHRVTDADNAPAKGSNTPEAKSESPLG